MPLPLPLSSHHWTWSGHEPTVSILICTIIISNMYSGRDFLQFDGQKMDIHRIALSWKLRCAWLVHGNVMVYPCPPLLWIRVSGLLSFTCHVVHSHLCSLRVTTWQYDFSWARVWRLSPTRVRGLVRSAYSYIGSRHTHTLLPNPGYVVVVRIKQG